ncbi:hypothetical protein L3W99_26285, partial [Escherichia coli]|uniref:hypothetical protein n=1 Tax=Escherichia coli TaxID=562 RepID=UPI001F1BF7DF
AQYRRKKALYPPVLLHHFVMEIVVLRPGQLIYLADGFCQPAFRYAVEGTVAKLAMRQPFVLFKGLTFQKLCLPGAFRPGD